MSVYTSVSKVQLECFLRQYPVGDLLRFSGIEAGVENTNYFVTTTQGEYVLTLYEELKASQLPFFLGLLDHLSRRQVATITPVPLQANPHSFISTLCDKPAALVQRLPGTSVSRVSVAHCRVIGAALAKMHLAGQGYPGESCRDGHRDDALQRIDTAEARARLAPDQLRLLQQELEHYAQLDLAILPQGIIHADLFRDNCLFMPGEPVRLSGIIDFYYASRDALLYDLAIVANDWCFDEQGKWDAQKHHALLAAYHAVRPFTRQEQQHWTAVLRIAALYFWVYRLLFNLYPRAGQQVGKKDAAVFQHKLQWYMQHPKVCGDMMAALHPAGE